MKIRRHKKPPSGNKKDPWVSRVFLIIKLNWHLQYRRKENFCQLIVNWFCIGNRREKSLPALQSPHSLRSLRSFPLPSLRGLKRRPRNALASYFHSQKKTTFRPDTGTGSPSLRDVRHFWQTLRQSCPCFHKQPCFCFLFSEHHLEK